MTRPELGEVWRVQFEPNVGDEIGKERPAVVLSSSVIGKLALSIVVPITSWQESFRAYSWIVELDPLPESGLTKRSSADAFQIKSVSHDRFVARLGYLPDETVDLIAQAAIICIESEADD